MENINLNIDAKTLEQCLKGISDFGGTTYQNICTGATSYVAWGSADWFLCVALSSIGLMFIGLFGTMLWKMATDY